MSYPARHMAKWTKQETSSMLSDIKNDFSIAEIANRHSRTVGAIRAQLLKHAYFRHKQDHVTIRELCELTRLSEFELSEYFIKADVKYNDKHQREPGLSAQTQILSDIRDLLWIISEQNKDIITHIKSQK